MAQFALLGSEREWIFHLRSPWNKDASSSVGESLAATESAINKVSAKWKQTIVCLNLE